jgi:hypothetical protein
LARKLNGAIPGLARFLNSPILGLAWFLNSCGRAKNKNAKNKKNPLTISPNSIIFFLVINTTKQQTP